MKTASAFLAVLFIAGGLYFLLLAIIGVHDWETSFDASLRFAAAAVQTAAAAKAIALLTFGGICYLSSRGEA